VTSCKAVLALGVLLLATVPLALAQGTYTQIDYPGALGGTYAFGIDNAGDLVGTYGDPNGTTLDGFLLTGGTYATIDYPGAQYTYLYGINNAGQVVGFTNGGFGLDLGFVYAVSTQAFTTVSYPGAISTDATSINDSGTTVGSALLGSEYIGFELTGSTYRKIVLGQDDIYDLAVIASGAVAGYGQSKNNPSYINFLFNDRKFRPLTIPLQFAQVLGINPAGNAVVGDYTPSIILGFLYQNKTLTTLQFPGAQQTFASGINDSGTVVGWFLDSQGNTHGFTWTPPAAAGKK
jgi:probable HAF family extracellular repeat protein